MLRPAADRSVFVWVLLVTVVVLALSGPPSGGATSASTVAPFVQTGVRVVPLYTGWNLVGWTGPERDPASIAAGIDGLQALFLFDSVSQSFASYRPGASAFNDLSVAPAGAGVWILMDQATLWSPPGAEAPRVVPLSAGFNLETWTGPSDSAVSAALAGLGCSARAAFA